MAHAPDPETLLPTPLRDQITIHPACMAYWHGLVPYPVRLPMDRPAPQQAVRIRRCRPPNNRARLLCGMVAAPALRSRTRTASRQAQPRAGAPLQSACVARGRVRACAASACTERVIRSPWTGHRRPRWCSAPTPAAAAVLCASIALTPAAGPGQNSEVVYQLATSRTRPG